LLRLLDVFVVATRRLLWPEVGDCELFIGFNLLIPPDQIVFQLFFDQNTVKLVFLYFCLDLRLMCFIQLFDSVEHILSQDEPFVVLVLEFVLVAFQMGVEYRFGLLKVWE
jgi:hypothetical protein